MVRSGIVYANKYVQNVKIWFLWMAKRDYSSMKPTAM